MLKFDKKQLDDLIGALSRLMDKNNLEELEISDNKFSYKLKKNSNDSEQIKPTVTDHTNEKEKKEIKPEKYLKSPLVGTAYLSPEPGSKQFVEVGQNVKIGQVILIIEAMKTMNEIVADRNGTVKKIYIKNETPVEFGEPLVLIE